MASDLSSPAPEQQSICTECALCCNGVLFDFVPAGTAEQPRLTKLGFGLRPRDGAAVFDQPCPMLIGSLCSVYGEHPDTCRGYRCQLLMKHQRGDVSRDEAMDRITKARALVAELKSLLAPGQGIVAARRAWKQRAADRRSGAVTGPANAGEAAFTLKMFVLNRFLDRHFRAPSEQQVVDADEGMRVEGDRRLSSPNKRRPRPS